MKISRNEWDALQAKVAVLARDITDLRRGVGLLFGESLQRHEFDSKSTDAARPQQTLLMRPMTHSIPPPTTSNQEGS